MGKIIVFALWGSGDVQRWNSPDDKTPLLEEENEIIYGSTNDELWQQRNDHDNICNNDNDNNNNISNNNIYNDYNINVCNISDKNEN